MTTSLPLIEADDLVEAATDVLKWLDQIGYSDSTTAVWNLRSALHLFVDGCSMCGQRCRCANCGGTDIKPRFNVSIEVESALSALDEVSAHLATLERCGYDAYGLVSQAQQACERAAYLLTPPRPDPPSSLGNGVTT